VSIFNTYSTVRPVIKHRPNFCAFNVQNTTLTLSKLQLLIGTTDTCASDKKNQLDLYAIAASRYKNEEH
jgi:hypothetical protein